MPGLDDDEDGDRHQGDAVRQGGEDLGPVVAERPFRLRGFWAIHRATSARASELASESMWPASASRASELVRRPPTTSATM